MTAVKEYIRSCKEALEPYIEDYIAGLAEKRAGSVSGLAELYEIFREAGRGGKCIRGSLVKLGHEIALGRPAGDEILPACAAFEILQTAILGHDDVIDKSPLRRGRDSIWRAVTRGRDDFHYGISQAICLGDVGIFLANLLIVESVFDAGRKIEAVKTFIDVQLNTVDGEMLDVLMSYDKDYGDEEGILRIANLKTAWYTIAGPLRLGAALAGASPELMDAMRRYGIFLGTAFQLRDDVLGINAAEEDIGKSNTSDIAEGKVTLLAYYAMKRAAPAQLGQLRRIYGSGAVSEADRVIVRNIFESTGAFAEVTKKAESYLAEAAGIIDEITQNAEHAALLAQLGDMMARRKS
ncbi:MAG: polyprenyl synthetase family protein [Synergistaceae bacterium]|nr:polyprenyl synthetase family protein [Synergistaceae bacterium]